MKQNLARKLLEAHLQEGELNPGEHVGLQFDQALLQDATGTLVMLALETMGLDRARTRVAVQYVDHNLIQEDNKNPDDHLFLLSAAQRFGIWYSRPGNGVSHPLHMQHFCVPGEALIGADSHTPANGCLGMLAIGAGGADVAQAMAGEPVFIEMPEIWGVKLTGELPPWVSAKDVILEMLRRHDVDGGINRIIEYYGPGVSTLHAMDRHVIANMGAELGATTTVFPSDEEIRRFLRSQNRGDDWVELSADEGCDYEHHDEIDLSKVEPLIAKPSSPGNVVPVAEVAGEPAYQAYIGSSANPGYRDFAVAAEIVKGKTVADHVSFDINPTSRQLLQHLIADSHLSSLLAAGARLHQAGCNGCIGMGQAPATGRNSLRTVPRNFAGRSGTAEDAVWLCSPETAAASALAGAITDPRTLGDTAPDVDLPQHELIERAPFVAPVDDNTSVELVKGPNIESLPDFEPLADSVELPVLLKVGDDLSTDEIMPAGARILPYRSNIPGIAEFVFEQVSDRYVDDAKAVRDDGGHVVVGGENYGQGSSREHAAVAPRYLGLRMVIAKSYARIHWQNLINYGVLPLEFDNAEDYEKLDEKSIIQADGLMEQLDGDKPIELQVGEGGGSISVRHSLSPRQREIIAAGSIVNWLRRRQG